MTKIEEITEMIKKATGRQLYHFMKVKKNKFKEECKARAKELNKDRFGDWDDAKSQIQYMAKPEALYETDDLLPINGYPVRYVTAKKQSFLAIVNPKTNSAYLKYFNQDNNLKTDGMF